MSVKAYKMFHGKDPKNTTGQPFHYPKRLIRLGEAIAVEYRCSKKNGGGDGRDAIYRHEFETPAIVAMDERCREQIYIIGKDIIVTDAGIEN